MKKIIILLMMISCLMFAQCPIHAVTEVPSSFKEYALIRYTSSNDYVVLEGEDYEKYQYNDEDYVEVSGDTIVVQGTQGNNSVGNYPLPFKDMFVQYGSDGGVNRVYTFKDNESLEQKDVDDYYIGSTYEEVRTWGMNSLYTDVNSNNYHHYGTGIASVFDNNVNQKGDVSIQRSYDDCAYNLLVKVRLPKKNGGYGYRYMRKRNSSDLDDSLIGIWKTGVGYWGYTYNSNLSIYDATIWHN